MDVLCECCKLEPVQTWPHCGLRSLHCPCSPPWPARPCSPPLQAQAFETLAYNWAAHVYMLRKEKQLVLASLDGALQARLRRRCPATALQPHVPRLQPHAARLRPCTIQVQLQRHRLPFFSFNAAGTTSADLRSNVTEFRRMGALKGEAPPR